MVSLNPDKDKRIGKLGNENYYAWSYRMEMRLRKLGVWSLVDGSEGRPVGSDNTKVVKAWRTRIDLALCEVVSEVEDGQLVHTRFSRDPAEVWERLRTVHQSQGLGSAISMWQRLFMMKKAPEISIQEHASVMREIADHLVGLGDKPSDMLLVAILMLSLPPSYSSLIISLDSHTNNKDFDFVVHRCMNEEARQLTMKQGVRGQKGSENVAYHTDPKPRKDCKDITCFKCQKKGHYQNECKEEAEAPKRDNAAVATLPNHGIEW